MDTPKLSRALDTQDVFDEYVRWMFVQHMLLGALVEMKDAKLPLPEMAVAIDTWGRRLDKHFELIHAMSEALAMALDKDAKRGKGPAA